MFEYLLGLGLLIVIASIFMFGSAIFTRLGALGFVLVALMMAAIFFLNYHQGTTQESIADYENTLANQVLIETYLHSKEEDTDLELLKGLDVSSLFNGIKRYLQLNPRDSEGWLILGNLLQGAKNHEYSMEAYRKAHLVNPNDSEMALLYVNARLSLTASSDKLDNIGVEVLEDVLNQSPANEQALMLMGVVAFKGKEFLLASESWQKLLNILEAKANPAAPNELLEAMKKSIANAKYQLSSLVSERPSTDKSNYAEPISKPRAEPQENIKTDISLEFNLALIIRFAPLVIEKLKPLVEGGQSKIFVYLKEPGQKGMPLAAAKLDVPKDLSKPLKLVITNRNSLMGQNLSSFSELELTARFSIRGEAVGSEGDWQAESKVISSPDFIVEQSLVIQSPI